MNILYITENTDTQEEVAQVKIKIDVLKQMYFNDRTTKME
jgi:hypothetical protein